MLRVHLALAADLRAEVPDWNEGVGGLSGSGDLLAMATTVRTAPPPALDTQVHVEHEDPRRDERHIEKGHQRGRGNRRCGLEGRQAVRLSCGTRFRVWA
jgi:hypothetical protein